MVNRHHKTGGLLPVLAFDPESHLFFCDDQTLGFGFLCQPLAGGDEKTENRLRVLLDEDWPAGTILSICLAASPNIVPYLRAMRRTHTGGGDDLLRQVRSLSHLSRSGRVSPSRPPC